MGPHNSSLLKEHEGGLTQMIPRERIRKTDFVRPGKEVVEKFLQLEDMTCIVSDVLDLFGIIGVISASSLSPVIPGSKIAGPAVTLRNIPGRITVTQGHQTRAKAKFAGLDIYSIAKPGDVIVIDAQGRKDVSNMGRLAALAAATRQIAGSIVYGAVRDLGGIKELKHPVWANSVTPKSIRFRTESAEINGQIECAGVQVNPGDLVLADDCGVVVVPGELVDQVLEKALEKAGRDDQAADAIVKTYK